MARWSEEEIEYLKENAPTTTAAELAKILGRTENSVKLKCNRIKINFKHKEVSDSLGRTYTRAYWTKEQKEYLKKNYPHESMDIICNFLQKSKKTIQNYAAIVGIKREVIERPYDDITGQVFGRLLVIKEYNKLINGLRYWECLCECGTRKIIGGSSIKYGNSKSCGCYHIDKVSGENSFFYNIDLTDEDRENNRYRNSTENAHKWRKDIFNRDNYFCAICSNRNGDRVAHHLDGWNWCKEKRFDIDNGVTLCVNCHKDFHSKYGYGDNTKEQFEEYKESKILIEVN